MFQLLYDFIVAFFMVNAKSLYPSILYPIYLNRVITVIFFKASQATFNLINSCGSGGN
jgi:hypothetical protein